MASYLLISTLLVLGLFETCVGKGLFSALPRTLTVTATPSRDGVLKTGEDKLTVTWRLNQSLPATTDDIYVDVKVKLCFAPISQKDRAWRKTKDELMKDKTCQFKIIDTTYDTSTDATGVQSFEWLLKRNVPTATYFVRVYAFNSEGHEAGYGQSTNVQKTSNLFEVQGISGRHVSLDIAAAVFSAFSLLSLGGFFYAEKRKSKAAQKN